MIIGGFQKFSLIDYPGKICAVVFARGCNFRCPYCHNPELVYRRLYRKPIPRGEIIRFLEKRKNSLEGLTLTGGEPLLQESVIAFLESVKKMRYAVKLDTNGSFPVRLKSIIGKKLVDYIAMDIKAPLEKYSLVAGVRVDPEKIRESIAIIMHSGLDYQFRTTLDKSFLDRDDIRQICGLIKGARSYIIQQMVVAGKPDGRTPRSKAEYSAADIRRYQAMATRLVRGK